jgi:hypothetical protein
MREGTIMTVTYERLWRNKWLTAHATSIDDMIACYGGAIEELRTLQQQDVRIDVSDALGDYITFTTTDPRVAQEFGFEEMDDEDVDDVAIVGNGGDDRR